MNSSGFPNRLVGAKNPVTWYPHEPENGYSVTGINSTWVYPISLTYDASSSASSGYFRERPPSSGFLLHDSRCTSYTETGLSKELQFLRFFIHFESFHG